MRCTAPKVWSTAHILIRIDRLSAQHLGRMPGPVGVVHYPPGQHDEIRMAVGMVEMLEKLTK